MNFFDPIFIIKSLGLWGTIGIIFIESGVFFGFFFPGDSLLFTAGLLASQGFFSFPQLFLGTGLAAILGGMFGYAFGPYLGRHFFSKKESWFFRKKHIETTSQFYERYGVKTIILARFLPVMRTFAPILAGIARMNYATFSLFNAFGAAIWAFGLTGLGYYLGRTIPNIDHYILPIILLIIATSIAPTFYEFVKQRRKNRS